MGYVSPNVNSVGISTLPIGKNEREYEGLLSEVQELNKKNSTMREIIFFIVIVIVKL
jgi:hypothetical protein